MTRYDFLIVGAGPFGAAFAACARAANRTCLVIDRKPHLGGAVYTERRPDDVHYSKYGPHVFHTESREQWQWVQQFGAMNSYSVRTKALTGGRLYSFPINLLTLHQVAGVSTPQEAQEWLRAQRLEVPGDDIESWCLRTIGRKLYEMFVEGYTLKQWGRPARELPASIVQRLPVRTDCDDSYFHSRYQGFPEDGWTSLVSNMLHGATLGLGEDYFGRRDHFDGLAKRVVYSGLLEHYFDCAYGVLPYRSLRFEDVYGERVVQGNAVVNYSDMSKPWTRVTEHKYFTFAEPQTSVATREYATEYDGSNEPFYPIETAENKRLHDKYRALATGVGGRVIFGGRGAMYKYWDLRHVLGQARTLARKALEEMK